MKCYYWKAIELKAGENVNGCIFANNEEEALEQLASYGYYTMIELEGEAR